MREFLALFLLVTSGTCELLIAVPQSTLPQQQSFNAMYIQKNSQQPEVSQPSINAQHFQQTPAESKSFNIFQQASNHLGIGRSDKGGGLTITIKLDPAQLNGLQQGGQGSGMQNGYNTNVPQRNPYIQQSNSIAEVLNGGANLIANPFSQQPATAASYQQNTITEVPLIESNSFLKSMTNLIRSQISALMDTPKQTSSSGRIQSQSSQHQQQYALFAPIGSTQQPLANIANFLTQKLQPQTLNTLYGQTYDVNKLPTQLHIAKPINVLPSATTTGTVTSDNEDSASPMNGAFSAIVKTVSQIPSSLDLMFNDMGRVYRQNLFSLRDKISEHPWSSMMPGIGPPPSKTKVEPNPWLDDFGA